MQQLKASASNSLFTVARPQSKSTHDCLSHKHQSTVGSISSSLIAHHKRSMAWRAESSGARTKTRSDRNESTRSEYRKASGHFVSLLESNRIELIAHHKQDRRAARRVCGEWRGEQQRGLDPCTGKWRRGGRTGTGQGNKEAVSVSAPSASRSPAHVHSTGPALASSGNQERTGAERSRR